MRLNINSYSFRYASAMLVVLMGISSAMASVVMTGNRIIYPADSREQSVQLTNKDSHPNVVQVWLDSGDEKSTPETGKAPFIVTPPFFRMEANAGQTLRLKYTGTGLPKDRESVFYLNFLQIPPVDKSVKNNKMMVMLRNRIKIFYRPPTIVGRADQVASALTFTFRQQGKDVVVTGKNPTGFYVTVAAAELTGGGKKVVMKSNMIPPMSQADWVVKNATAPSQNGALMSFSLVNDYGGQDSGSYKFGR